MAMPRSASAGGSSRKATRFNAPRGSPAASAWAAALINESIGIPPHLSLPPLRHPAVNIAHGQPGQIENGQRGPETLNKHLELKGVSKMRKVKTFSAVLALLCSLTVSAQNNQTGRDTNKLAPLPRDLEIQLALSALPPHLRDHATIYVLNPDKGFAVARQGTNGFHAFVARTGDDTFRGTWPLKAYRDDILYPISFDEAGAKEQMRIFFDAAEMQAKGTPPEELKRIIQERYKTNHYRAPERAGVSYMLAPILRTYTNPDANDDVATANVPHVMYYAPNVSNEDVGAAAPRPEDLRYFSEHGHFRTAPYPFVILHGPHGYMIQFRGDAERAVVNQEYDGMLARLCQIKEAWCLPE